MSSELEHHAGDDSTLTFAHLSDLHLTSPEGARAAELANKRLLSYLSWRRRRRFVHDPRVLARLAADLRQQAVGHLAITGDLTQLGLPLECEAARSWLEDLAPPDRVSLVPGNHDRLVDDDWSRTLGLWGDYLFPSGSRDARDFPTLRVRGPAAFIGVSSARAMPPLLATGKVGGRQRDRLAHLLEDTGRKGLCRILLIHHPPVPGACKWRKRLVDAAAVADVIGAHGAELVLHGHTHRTTRHVLTGPGGRPIPVAGLSSASAGDSETGRRARYSLWTVGGSPGRFSLTHRARVHDPATGTFGDDHDWDPLHNAGHNAGHNGGNETAA